jgi:uncharacterized membrane protein YeaQ/YmgE (transglycosylase-associated protein family)
MGILSWIILGLIAGGLAKFIMPGKDPGGCIITCILGIVGAVIGGWIGTLIGLGSVNQLDLKSIGIAIIGSLVVLGIYRLVARKPQA